MGKLEQLKKKIEEIQTKSVVSGEMKAFIKLVLEISNKNKEELAKLSKDNLKVINDSVAYIEEFHEKQINTIKDEKNAMVGHFDTNLALLKGMLEEIQDIKATPGKDGKDGTNGTDGKDGKDGKDGSPDTGEEIADKLEALKGDDRLDKSAIKGIEDLEKQISSRPVISGGITQAKVLQLISENAGSGHVIEDEGTPLTQRANMNFVGAGVTVTDAGGKTLVTIPGGGGTIDGSGTLNELTYWVDSDTVGSLTTVTYPSLTELSYVKGVSSAIQTQLNTKAPSTSPTFATSITGSYLTASEILITDGSKNIVSAPVATYPSLTELTYVKGVTSSIQTQLNAKGVGDALTSGALTQFVGNGNWKVFYSNGTGDVTELALGADGTFLKSNGLSAAPSFATPAGSGDVSKVGTPVNNQVGVWTGDGTLEGDADLTFDGLILTVDGIKIFTGTNSVQGNISIGEVGMTGANSGTGFNTAIGYSASQKNTSGAENVAVGYSALVDNLTGSRNVAVGGLAGNALLGSDNTIIGYDAFSLGTGNTNTVIGRHALNTAGSQSGNVAIGYYAGKYNTDSNSLYIDNQNRTNTAGDKAGAIIYGVFNATPSSQTLTFNAVTNSAYDFSVPDEVYGVGWNGSLEVPTKNAVYDKIESMGGGVTEAFVVAMATAL